MAKMVLWLAERIVGDRLGDRTPQELNLQEEQTFLSADEGKEWAEDMARIATHSWFRIYDELVTKYPLLITSEQEEQPPKLPGRTSRKPKEGTKKNHYVPQFTVRPWADSTGRIRVLRRDANGGIISTSKAVSGWAYEQFLYPAEQEEWLMFLESRSKAPYEKLCRVETLSLDDRYFWIAFLIVQFMRTPAYMAALAQGLRDRGKREGWPYQLTPELLRRSYLELFQDDRIFAAQYRLFDTYRWKILTAPAGHTFPRTDVPVCVSQAGDPPQWSAVYPLTPTRCFAVGPERALESDVPAALTSPIGLLEMQRLQASLVRCSRASIAVATSDDIEIWKTLADRSLPRPDSRRAYRAWGRLAD